MSSGSRPRRRCATDLQKLCVRSHREFVRRQPGALLITSRRFIVTISHNRSRRKAGRSSLKDKAQSGHERSRSGEQSQSSITGSGGLIGSECVRLFSEEGWKVYGLDNDMRSEFFGPDGSTRPVVEDFGGRFRDTSMHDLDIRDRNGIRDIVSDICPSLIVHCAAQPSHDLAAPMPFEDFDVNAVGTLNLLEAARHARRLAVLLHEHNKVYGDPPNDSAGGAGDPLGLRDPAVRTGIAETMPIDDACTRSSVHRRWRPTCCQEYGRYFGHEGGHLPRRLSHRPATRGRRAARLPLVSGQGGRSKDDVHGFTATRANRSATTSTAATSPGRSIAFHGAPDDRARSTTWAAARANSCSILEAIDWSRAGRRPLQHSIRSATSARGDHICYISDLTRLRAQFPGWELRYGLEAMLLEMLDWQAAKRAAA